MRLQCNSYTHIRIQIQVFDFWLELAVHPEAAASRCFSSKAGRCHGFLLLLNMYFWSAGNFCSRQWSSLAHMFIAFFCDVESSEGTTLGPWEQAPIVCVCVCVSSYFVMATSSDASGRCWITRDTSIPCGYFFTIDGRTYTNHRLLSRCHQNYTLCFISRGHVLSRA